MLNKFKYCEKKNDNFVFLSYPRMSSILISEKAKIKGIMDISSIYIDYFVTN